MKTGYDRTIVRERASAEYQRSENSCLIYRLTHTPRYSRCCCSSIRFDARSHAQNFEWRACQWTCQKSTRYGPRTPSHYGCTKLRQSYNFNPHHDSAQHLIPYEKDLQQPPIYIVGVTLQKVNYFGGGRRRRVWSSATSTRLSWHDK
jgi:hypothetical protein